MTITSSVVVKEITGAMDLHVSRHTLVWNGSGTDSNTYNVPFSQIWAVYASNETVAGSAMATWSGQTISIAGNTSGTNYVDLLVLGKK